MKSEIVAFLNSEGGTVFVGVEDDGTVIGFKGSCFHEARKRTGYLEITRQRRVKTETLPMRISAGT